MRPSIATSHLVQHPADVERAAEAAGHVVSVHKKLAEHAKPGMTLAQLDRFVASTLDSLRCRSCFLGYRIRGLPPFPSHACLSVNECVVHGTAGYLTRPLDRGDLLSVDVGVQWHGWIGDAAWTYAMGEVPSEEADRLMRAGKESLRRGVQTLRPGNLLLAWAQEVQRVVEHEAGLHLVAGLGGHGYGKRLHNPPFVANAVPLSPAEWPESMTPCTPGMLLAVEPMLASGMSQTRQGRNQWPIFTADGSLSVHYEHDVLITEGGPRVLTAGLADLPDVLG